MEAGEGSEKKGMFDVSENLLQIAFETIQNKFPQNLRCFRILWRGVVKPSKYVSDELKSKVKGFYKTQRYADATLFKQFAQLKLE